MKNEIASKLQDPSGRKEKDMRMLKRSPKATCLSSRIWIILFFLTVFLLSQSNSIYADTITFADFSDLSGFTLNGAAQAFSSGQYVLRANEGAYGSAFLTTPFTLDQNNSFSTAFQFQILNAGGISDSDGPGGDGFAFVLQSQGPTALGCGGGYLGYGYGVTWGGPLAITPSLGIEFDTFDNGTYYPSNGDDPIVDPNGNHVGIDLNGSLVSLASAAVSPRLNSGEVWYAWIDYDGISKLIEVRVSQSPVRPDTALLSQTVDLNSIFGSSDVYAGFTGGGCSAGEYHDIRSWQFTATPVSPVQYVPFSVTFNWSDSFSIYGYQPDPHVDGFDYYFTPLAIDTSLLGRKVIISDIDVSVTGTSIGSVINWDWEVHLGPSPFGFPEGQFVKTHIDPVAGYLKTAPTQLQFVVGSPYPTDPNYIFSGNYDFLTSTMTATPQLQTLKRATTSEMNLTDGLYAQLFFWTGDNRNCHIVFEDATLTVSGKVKIPIPKEINIDIKPGASPNCFNQNERGAIPVAILGSSDLDVEDIETDSLSLQGLAVKIAGKSDRYLSHYDYVNDDEFIDLVVQFEDTDGWVSSGDGYATLKGYLTSGISIEGKDTICIVP